MAEDNIYHVRVHFEGPSQPASIGIYYQEVGLSTAVVGGTQSLAESFDLAMTGRYIGLLSEEWQLSGYEVARMDGDPIAKHLHSMQGRPGQRNGSSLPANNCLLIQLFQVSFPKTSNGRQFIPGLAEGDTDVGRITQAFADTQVSSYTTRIAQSVSETNGTGHWLPGVISAKVRDAAPGFKDWEGAFSQVVGALGWPVIARQRRRQTKVRGAF